MADPTIIDAGTRIDGRIAGDADVTVQGRVDGEIELSEVLTVGDGGFVHGQISVREAHVEGAVDGDIVAQERIFLAASARVVGSLEAPGIEIADGAQFSGEVIMDLEGAAPARSTTSRSTSSRPATTANTATASRSTTSSSPATSSPATGSSSTSSSSTATATQTRTTTTTVVDEEPEPADEPEPDEQAEASEAEEADVTDMSKRELQDYTVKELREELRDRDLQVSGTKDELIERLQNAGES